MEPMIEKQNDVTIIRPEGEIDTHNCDSLKEVIQKELRSGAKRLLIDMSNVSYLDSAALGVLVSGFKSARASRAQFKLANMQPPVAKIFQLTRLSKFFDIHQNSDEAIASFK